MRHHASHPMSRTLATLLVGASAVLAVGGCSEVGKHLPPPEQTYALTQGEVARPEYRLQPGDRLNIKFP